MADKLTEARATAATVSEGRAEQTFMDAGISVPIYPLIDAETDNIDDWLLAHQVEHQAFAGFLDLNNPFNMLDVDFNNESDFYDWIATHLYIHQQIVAALGISETG